MSLGKSGPVVRGGFQETPRTRCNGVCLAAARTASQVAVSRHAGVALGPLTACGCRSRAARLSVARKNGRSKVGLHDLAPLGRWGPGWCEQLLPAAFSQPDVAAGPMDQAGNSVPPFSSAHGRLFSEGPASVHLGEGAGFIDETGATAFGHDFVGVDPFPHGLAVATVHRPGSRPALDFITGWPQSAWKSTTASARRCQPCRRVRLRIGDRIGAQAGQWPLVVAAEPR